MDLKWLEDFLTLAETRNFSRAAERRSTTQPSFSRRIKALEDWLGAPLFERAAQPVMLTEAGKQFRPAAEDAVRRLYQAREELRFSQANAGSVVKFAATHSLSLTFFPRWIAELEQRASPVNIRLDTGHAGMCVQLLLLGASHFMLCHTHPAIDIGLDPRLSLSCRAGADRLVPVSLAGPDGRPLAALDAKGGHPVRYLAYAGTSAIGRALDHKLRHTQSALRLEPLFVSDLAAVLKSMVAAGRGLAWLPESHVAAELASGSFVRAGPEMWDLDVDITLFRLRDRLPPVAEAFWSAAQQGAAMP